MKINFVPLTQRYLKSFLRGLTYSLSFWLCRSPHSPAYGFPFVSLIVIATWLSLTLLAGVRAVNTSHLKTFN